MSFLTNEAQLCAEMADLLLKAAVMSGRTARYPVGTVRRWGNRPYKKVSEKPARWVPVSGVGGPGRPGAAPAEGPPGRPAQRLLARERRGMAMQRVAARRAVVPSPAGPPTGEPKRAAVSGRKAVLDNLKGLRKDSLRVTRAGAEAKTPEEHRSAAEGHAQLAQRFASTYAVHHAWDASRGDQLTGLSAGLKDIGTNHHAMGQLHSALADGQTLNLDQAKRMEELRGRAAAAALLIRVARKTPLPDALSMPPGAAGVAPGARPSPLPAAVGEPPAGGTRREGRVPAAAVPIELAPTVVAEPAGPAGKRPPLAPTVVAEPAPTPRGAPGTRAATILGVGPSEVGPEKPKTSPEPSAAPEVVGPTPVEPTTPKQAQAVTQQAAKVAQTVATQSPAQKKTATAIATTIRDLSQQASTGRDSRAARHAGRAAISMLRILQDTAAIATSPKKITIGRGPAETALTKPVEEAAAAAKEKVEQRERKRERVAREKRRAGREAERTSAKEARGKEQAAKRGEREAAAKERLVVSEKKRGEREAAAKERLVVSEKKRGEREAATKERLVVSEKKRGEREAATEGRRAGRAVRVGLAAREKEEQAQAKEKRQEGRQEAKVERLYARDVRERQREKEKKKQVRATIEGIQSKVIRQEKRKKERREGRQEAKVERLYVRDVEQRKREAAEGGKARGRTFRVRERLAAKEAREAAKEARQKPVPRKTKKTPRGVQERGAELKTRRKKSMTFLLQAAQELAAGNLDGALLLLRCGSGGVLSA